MRRLSAMVVGKFFQLLCRLILFHFSLAARRQSFADISREVETSTEINKSFCVKERGRIIQIHLEIGKFTFDNGYFFPSKSKPQKLEFAMQGCSFNSNLFSFVPFSLCSARSLSVIIDKIKSFSQIEINCALVSCGDCHDMKFYRCY
jgi:hypothetical protein